MKTTASHLETITRKWWFYLLVICAQFILFPVATRNFSINDAGRIIQTTLGNALIFRLASFFPYIQVLTLLCLLALFILKDKFSKPFSAYVAFTYVLFALVQNMAWTGTYGLSLVTVNILMFSGIAFVWFREALHPRTVYTFSNFNWKTVWMIPLALLAFWTPLDLHTLHFDFTGRAFLTNGSALTFCMMTPVYLTLLTLNMPSVNRAVYRITAFIGIILGCYNMFNFFNPYTVNLGILHLPLLIISIYSFSYSFTYKISISNHQ